MTDKEIEMRVAKHCKQNPYEAFKVIECYCNSLQLMTIRDFAKIAKQSERTIYNMVKDVENAQIEVLTICNDKFIPAILNKKLTS